MKVIVDRPHFTRAILKYCDGNATCMGNITYDKPSERFIIDVDPSYSLDEVMKELLRVELVIDEDPKFGFEYDPNKE
jgi:hypothetical protein